MRLMNDWKPETRSLIETLMAGGHIPTRGNNGENGFNFDPSNIDAFIAELIATDESRLFVKCPDGKVRWLFLVFGNCPGELVADYLCPANGEDTLDPLVQAHYDAWCNRKQPTIELEPGE